VALVQLRHFLVHAECEPALERVPLDFVFRSRKAVSVDLATLLEANATAEHELEWELRYRVLQNELRIVLSFLHEEPYGNLQLDNENFVATAAHIKRFVSESVGLGMLTAAVKEYFSWQYGSDSIYNFDVLPGEMQDELPKKGVRPDLLFKFDDGFRVLAGEARGRSGVGPRADVIRNDQHKRMQDILGWSAANGAYPITMTWAYLGGDHVQVDLFTMSEESIGSLAYQPTMETPAELTQRELVTIDAVGRGERRAQRLFETAPPAPAREPRRLFDREVRGSWVTADFARPSNVRMFLGVTDGPIPPSRVRAARSRRRRAASPAPAEYETAVSDRLVIVVAHSDDAEPEWSRVEASVQEGEHDG
jgi:hypothetical protein